MSETTKQNIKFHSTTTWPSLHKELGMNHLPAQVPSTEDLLCAWYSNPHLYSPFMALNSFAYVLSRLPLSSVNCWWLKLTTILTIILCHMCHFHLVVSQYMHLFLGDEGVSLHSFIIFGKFHPADDGVQSRAVHDFQV